LLLFDQEFNSRLPGQLVAQEIHDKFNILWPASSEFAKRQVLHLQTPTNSTAGVFTADANQSVFLSGRQTCGFWSNAVRIISMRLVKQRAFPNRPINQV